MKTLDDQIIEVQSVADTVVDEATETSDNLLNAANSIGGKALHTAANLKKKAKDGIANAEATMDEAKMTVLDNAGDVATDFEAAIEATPSTGDE